jgi:deoxyribonuclease (pyrimidine dimer)
MTRINTVSPEFLTDKWLLAEYRELPRVSALAKKTRAPEKYVLGTGHVTFFYDKGLFLQKRFHSIVDELCKRGYNINFSEYRLHPDGLNLDWIPDLESIQTNASRLLEKFDLGQKHSIYKKPITKDEYKKLLDTVSGVR